MLQVQYSRFNTPVHVVYGVGEDFQQGLLVNNQMRITADRYATRAFNNSPIQLSVPVLFPEEVLGIEGSTVGNCWTAACSAVFRGWGF